MAQPSEFNTTTLIVDDTSSLVTYSAGWVQGFSGAGFSDSVDEFNKTKHGASSALATARFSFTGTSVAVYGSLGSFDVNGVPVSSYSVDGAHLATYTAPIIEPPGFATRVLFYQSPPLTSGQHELVITNLNGTAPSVYWLDYILFDPSVTTNPTTSPPSQSSSLSSSLSSSTPSPPSNTASESSSVATTQSTPSANSAAASSPAVNPKHVNVASIVGSVMGGVVAAAILLALLLLLSRRRINPRRGHEVRDLLSPEPKDTDSERTVSPVIADNSRVNVRPLKFYRPPSSTGYSESRYMSASGSGFGPSPSSYSVPTYAPGPSSSYALPVPPLPARVSHSESDPDRLAVQYEDSGVRWKEPVDIPPRYTQV